MTFQLQCVRPNELTTVEAAKQLGIGRRQLHNVRDDLDLSYRIVELGERQYALYSADSVARAAVRRAAMQRGLPASQERARVASATRKLRAEVEKLAFDVVRAEHRAALVAAGADAPLRSIPANRLPAVRDALVALVEMRRRS